MDLRQKEYFWLLITIMFYLLTGYFGAYGISQALFWPILGIPLSLFLVKTGQKEIGGLVGVLLSIIISFLGTSTFNPIIVASFLIFIVAPTFIFGTLYNRKATIPWIIMITTVVCFFGWIVFLTFSKFLGIDYVETYFLILDTSQGIWNSYLTNIEVQKMFPGDPNILKLYMEVMAQAVRIAKRTYPATLFTVSLITTTVHLLIIQLIARIRSWNRPLMKDILSVGLSPVAAWVLVILWIVTMQMGDIDTIWTFATESMLNVLFVLFQIVGLITMIVMIMKIGTTKLIRVVLSIISMLWLLFNPTILVVIGCMDSMFNFRKAKTLI